MEAGSSERAEWWGAFLLDHIDYPSPVRLASQIDGARFEDSCPCHCNTYAVEPKPDAFPLVQPFDGPVKPKSVLIFNASIPLSDGRYLDLDLFADPQGNLCELAVECCANSYPVPEIVEIGEGSIKTMTYGKLLADPK